MGEVIKYLEEKNLPYQDMGCKYVVVPYLTEECRPGTDGWESTVAGIEKIGKVAKADKEVSSQEDAVIFE